MGLYWKLVSNQPSPRPPSANNTVWDLERIVGPQTFTAQNAAQVQASGHSMLDAWCAESQSLTQHF